MQFKVPQFLEIEDKIFGPFTFKQFAYLAGGAGVCFVLFKAMGVLLGGIPIIIVAGLSLALTFFRPNNKPFVNMLESSVKYFMQSKLYIWKKNTEPREMLREKTPVASLLPKAPKITGSKLRDLAWSLDVLDLKK